MFSLLFPFFFLISLRRSVKTIETPVQETMKPLESLLVGLGRLIAGHHDLKMLPKMVKREVMVRDVYDWTFFESRDPVHIKYHQTRPRGNIMKAQSNTAEPRQFCSSATEGAWKKLYMFFVF